MESGCLWGIKREVNEVCIEGEVSRHLKVQTRVIVRDSDFQRG